MDRLKNAVVRLVMDDPDIPLGELFWRLFAIDVSLFRECGETLSGARWICGRDGPFLQELKDALFGFGPDATDFRKMVFVSFSAHGTHVLVPSVRAEKGAYFDDERFTGREVMTLAGGGKETRALAREIWSHALASAGENGVIDEEAFFLGMEKEEKEEILEKARDAKMFAGIFGPR